MAPVDIPWVATSLAAAEGPASLAVGSTASHARSSRGPSLHSRPSFRYGSAIVMNGSH